MAAARARTAWTPSTRSTPTPATTRSRTSRPTCRCACCATSCARTWPAPASGAAAWARCASSPSCRDGGASVEGEGHRYQPWGFLGGGEGAPAKLDLVTPDGTATKALPSKVPHMNIAKDGRFICYGPAGGGYGNPLERDPQKVADDVLDGVISPVDRAQGLPRRGLGQGRGRPGGDREGARRPLASGQLIALLDQELRASPPARRCGSTSILRSRRRISQRPARSGRAGCCAASRCVGRARRPPAKPEPVSPPSSSPPSSWSPSSSRLSFSLPSSSLPFSSRPCSLRIWNVAREPYASFSWKS